MSPEEHIYRAKEQGVSRILDPGLWVTDFHERYQHLHQYPEIIFGLACAPHYRRKTSQKTEKIEDIIQTMEGILDTYPVMALSEIGLDYYHLVRKKEIQHELFLKQMELASRRDLPVFLHIRDAYEDAFDLVIKSGHRRGAVHCFTGSLEDARRFTDWGFSLSFSGIVTFKNSQEMREIVKKTPDKKILTETDSPFLTPMPFRGEPNESGNIVYINRCIATIKGWTDEKCHQKLEENARKLIGF